MAELDDLNSWINAQDKQAASTATVAVAGDGSTSPDEAAKNFNTAHEYAKVTGNPVPPVALVKDNRSEFQKQIDATNRYNVLAASPRLTSWLTNPDNSDVASITGDDLGALSYWDKVGQNTAEAGKAIPGGAVTGTGQALIGAGRLIGPDTKQPEPVAPVAPADAGYGERFLDWALGIRAQAIHNSDQLPANMVKAGEALTAEGKTILPAADGFEDSWGRSIGATLGAILPLLAAGATTGGAGALLTGGAQMAGSGAEDAKAHGADEATQQEAALANAPLGFLDLGPVLHLLDTPAAKEGILQIAKSVGAQAALQGGTGAIQTVASNEVAKHLYDANRGALDGMADAAATGGAVGLLADLAKLGIGAMVHRNMSAAQARTQTAADTFAQLGDMAKNAQASQTLARAPDVFRSIVANGVEGTNKDSVYVPADKFVEYFQSIGADPDKVADALTGVTADDLRTAYNSGGDLRIPTETFATDIAPTEHSQFLMENMRFDPKDMTFAEAKAFNESADDIRQQAFDEAENQRLDDEANRSTEQVIYDEMLSRLRAAGRSNEVATNEAELYPAFYSKMAAANGMTTAEMVEQYPLPQVSGAIPEGMQLRSNDELNRVLAEARGRKEVKETRPSLLEFIDQYGGVHDRGGELKAMDAEVIRRGKGKKTLKIARKIEKSTTGDMLAEKPADSGKKYGPDDVAQAAIEAGYLANDPIANEYRAAIHEGRQPPDITRSLWDAIGREVRGEPDFAEPQGPEADKARQLDEIEAYLDTLGVSLKNSDDEIRAAIEGAKMYAQSSWGDRISGLLDFAKSSVRGVLKREVIAPVSPRLAEVLKAAGIDATGYHHDIDADAIRHMFKQHGDEKAEAARGQIAVTDADVEAIPAIIDAPDAVVTGAKNRRSQDVIGYIKRMPDGTALYLEEVRTGRNTLSATSMRKYPADKGFENIAKTMESGSAPATGSSGEAGTVSTSETSPELPGLTVTRMPPKTSRLLFQKNEAGARGSIQLPAGGVASGASIIRLFEGANLSTFVHESGHFFLSVMQDMADKGGSASIDFENVKKWWKENAKDVAADAKRALPDVDVSEADVHAALENGTTGDLLKDAAVNVGMQEQFARGFESYLMEGKAPSLDLRTAFEKFRSWMISIYQKAANLRVNISPEIRQVFDRMLASDAAIKEAHASAGETGPVFATAEQMGLNPRQFERFMQLRTQAEDEAKARLLRETMKPIKRQQDAEYKAAKKEMTQAVTDEVSKYNAYRAIDWMANQEVHGSDQPVDDLRLDKNILVERYGPGILETLPRGKRKVYGTEGNVVDPDDIAGLFGYDSGDELVRGMEQAPPKAEAIKAEVEKRMRDKYGDPLNDGTIEADALAAVHNDKKAEWLATELKAVTEAAGLPKALTAKEARAGARDATAKMRVRDAADSRRYLAAERKAGAEAEKLGRQLARNKVWLDQARRHLEKTARAAAKGDATQADVGKAIDAHNREFETTPHDKGYNDLVSAYVDAKRRQLVNHALYGESVKIAKEVSRAENLVKRLGSKASQARIAGAGRRENAQVDYLAAMNELIDRYDFRHLTEIAEVRRGALNDFVQKMTAAGRDNELAIPDRLMNDLGKAPYKTVPVEELRGLVDSLKNIEHVATRWNDLIDRENTRNFTETLGKMQETIKETQKDNPPSRLGSTKERIVNGAKAYLNTVLNATTLLRELDGGKDQGTIHEAIKAPLDKAALENVERQEKSRKALEKLFETFTRKERRNMARRAYDPVLKQNISPWEKIAIALNTGNADNMQRLTDEKLQATGGSFTPDQVQYVLDSMGPKEAKFIQGVWDHLETYWPDIADRERRTTGTEPKRVDAQPVTIGGQELRGGYYPLKYDAEFSALAADMADEDLAAAMRGGGFAKAQTRSGHLKSRAGSSGQAIRLDMSVLAGHITQVNYDLSYSEAVTNSWRLLNGLRGDLTRVGRSADFNTLRDWLLDVGTGELRSQDIYSTLASIAKNNFTMAKLSFSVATALGQLAGFAQSMVVVGKRNFALGVMHSLKPGIRADVVAKSTYMAKRDGLFHKDIRDYFESSQRSAAGSRWGDFKTWAGKVGFWLMEKIQYQCVDLPTWLAGYHQGLEQFGNDEAKAIAHADDVVKRAQGSGLFQDKTAAERGSLGKTRQNAFIKLFSALGSYMFTKGNIAYEQARKTGRAIDADGGGALAYAKHGISLAADMVALFTVDAVFMAAIRGTMPAILGGTDDDGKAHDGWPMFLAKQTGYSVLGTLPFIRDGASVFQGFDGGGAYGSVIGDAAKGVKGVGGVINSMWTGDDIKTSDVGSIINGMGLAAGIPATQIGRTVSAGMRQLQGQQVSPLEYVLGKRG